MCCIDPISASLAQPAGSGIIATSPPRLNKLGRLPRDNHHLALYYFASRNRQKRGDHAASSDFGGKIESVFLAAADKRRRHAGLRKQSIFDEAILITRAT